MRQDMLPASRDLVLIGGGHTHALVLRRWAMDPLPGARVTLIHPGPGAPYSGMLPGHVAGHYTRDALEIDLVRLARAAGARLVFGAASGIDRDTRRIAVPGRPPVAYDIASIDIGVTSAMPALPGFTDHGVPAKPLGPFADAWSRYCAGEGPAAVAVVGGGVAGAELAMAMAHALRARGRSGQVHLVDRAEALSAFGDATRRRLLGALGDCGVQLQEHADIARVDETGLHLSDGGMIEAGFVTGAAGARAHAWIASTGLQLDDGFIVIDKRLRSSDERIFAVGDCAEMAFDPRPKAGVYAVRQAPVLFDNLRGALSGAGGLRPYRPQRDYLKLISLGGKTALADRFGVSLSGPLLWRWKDGIDRGFMARFRDFPRPARPALPWPRAAGAREALGPKPLCGGCGAKIGRARLVRGLGDAAGSGDDAAILATGGARQVMSTDHLRAFTEDPVVMARIAAVHALGDIWAMGARPQAALLSVTLPRLAPELAERSLAEIADTARVTLQSAGAALSGGHSTIGAELTIGLSVTGLCDREPITLEGGQPGDALVLTKPLGSGVILAAEMAGRARGAWVAQALDRMSQPQGRAASILSGARAMTDVTGFGLAGHLSNLCAASGTGAALDVAAIPLMPGARDLARRGIRSTLFEQNRLPLEGSATGPEMDLLFDPQTGGGLLAALPHADAEAAVRDLVEAGYEAAVIGVLTNRAGQIAAV